MMLRFAFRAPVRRLIAVITLALLAPAPVSARVGAASVVNGEPLGKPPQAVQGVLHIGNDMTADEVVTTKANDRAHIVFLDGSTLTVGPDSTVTIDKFVSSSTTPRKGPAKWRCRRAAASSGLSAVR